MFGVHLTDPAAALAADLMSIVEDLKFAEAGFRRVYETDDDHLRRALWSSAVIAYRRGFQSGRSLIGQLGRHRLGALRLDALGDDHGATSAWLLSEASGHVAHRVSSAEQAQVIAVLDPPPSPPRLDGVMLLHVHNDAPTADRCEAAAETARIVREKVDAEASDALDVVHEAVIALSLDDLYAAARFLV